MPPFIRPFMPARLAWLLWQEAAFQAFTAALSVATLPFEAADRIRGWRDDG